MILKRQRAFLGYRTSSEELLGEESCGARFGNGGVISVASAVVTPCIWVFSSVITSP